MTRRGGGEGKLRNSKLKLMLAMVVVGGVMHQTLSPFIRGKCRCSFELTSLSIICNNNNNFLLAFKIQFVIFFIPDMTILEQKRKSIDKS